VTAHRSRAFNLVWERGRIDPDDLERLFVDAAHEVGVERAGGSHRVRGAEVVDHVARPGDEDLGAPLLPEEEFEDAFGVREVVGAGRVIAREGHRAIDRHVAVRALEGERERHRSPAGAGSGDERPVAEKCRAKFGVEGGAYLGADLQQIAHDGGIPNAENTHSPSAFSVVGRTRQ
jgi:hypothetical protein